MYAISEYVMIRVRMMIINFQMNGFHVFHCTFSLSNYLSVNRQIAIYVLCDTQN